MRRAENLIVFLFLASLVCSCASNHSTDGGNEDAPVLQAVLDDPQFHAWLQTPEVLLLDTTSAPSEIEGDALFLREALGPSNTIAPELLTDLRERNRSHWKLAGLRTSLEVVTAAEMLRRWPGDVQNYGRLFTWLSRPGYSTDRSIVAVSVTAHNQGPCCGRGYIALLEAHNGRWQVLKHVTEWIE